MVCKVSGHNQLAPRQSIAQGQQLQWQKTPNTRAKRGCNPLCALLIQAAGIRAVTNIISVWMQQLLSLNASDLNPSSALQFGHTVDFSCPQKTYPSWPHESLESHPDTHHYCHCFETRPLLCKLGWSWAHCVMWAGLELAVILIQPHVVWLLIP